METREPLTDTTVRSFIALPLPASLQQQLKPLRHQLGLEIGDTQKPLRWVKSQNLHTTLFFLGNQTLENLETVKLTLQEKDAWPEPFPLKFTQLTLFPPRHPHVIALLGLGNSAFNNLVAQLRRKLLAAGIHFDDKKVSPHITLARCDRSIDLKPRAVDVEFLVDKLVLFKSITESSGPVYQVLDEVRLV